MPSTRWCAPIRSPTCPDTPYPHVSATTDESAKKLTLAVVNRHPTADIVLEGFTPQGTGEGYEVNGPSLDSTNTFAEPDNVTLKKRSFSGAGRNFRQTFPAHSVNVLTIPA